MYNFGVAAERRYHLQSEDANRRIDALLEQLRVPAASWRVYSEMLTTALKLYEDGADLADLKITNAALKEMRYGYKVFRPYRDTSKVTIFGSARLAPDHPVSRQAHAFAARMVKDGWMVITGAGSGVMGAAQEGAGRERSFGLNIRLPFEQEANPWIADDPKLITFKYFFTRKLFLVREATGMAFFPGGFGTCDEAFEMLTLMQTGKAAIVPVVLVDAPGGGYWRDFIAFMRAHLVAEGMIGAEDVELFRLADDVDEAARELQQFYLVFHSMRYVGDDLVVRVKRPLAPERVGEMSSRFADLLAGPIETAPGPLQAEAGFLPDLPRLILPFNRRSYGRLRQLIDAINQS